jgi:hypothetical protein
VNLRLDHLEAVAAGVVNRKQPGVPQHRVERGAQVMSNSGEIHRATSHAGSDYRAS